MSHTRTELPRSRATTTMTSPDSPVSAARVSGHSGWPANRTLDDQPWLTQRPFRACSQRRTTRFGDVAAWSENFLHRKFERCLPEDSVEPLGAKRGIITEVEVDVSSSGLPSHLVQRCAGPSGSAVRRVAGVEAGGAAEGVVGGAGRQDSVLVALVAVGDKTSGQQVAGSMVAVCRRVLGEHSLQCHGPA